MQGLGLKGLHKELKGMSLKGRLDKIKLELKYAWQRAHKGYDDRWVFGYIDMFKDTTIAALEEYKNNHIGSWWSPDGYELGTYNETFNAYILTNDQQLAILDTIIWHLKMSNEDFCEKQLFGSCVEDDDYIIGCRSYDEHKRINIVIKQNQDAAMDLIKMFLNDMWD